MYVLRRNRNVYVLIDLPAAGIVFSLAQRCQQLQVAITRNCDLDHRAEVRHVGDSALQKRRSLWHFRWLFRPQSDALGSHDKTHPWTLGSGRLSVSAKRDSAATYESKQLAVDLDIRFQQIPRLHKSCDERVPRTIQDLFWCTDLDDLALMDHAHSVRYCHHLGEIVAHVNGRRAGCLLHLLQLPAQGVARVLVERADWFVQQ